MVRTLDETEDLFDQAYFTAGKPNLTGVAYPPGAHTLLLLDQPASGETTLALMAPPNLNTKKVSKTSLEIADPSNLAFDSINRGAQGYGIARLFALDANLSQLIVVKASAQNVMEAATIESLDTKPFGVTDPQGMTIDPDTGLLYLLDGASTIVSLKPKPGRAFAQAKVTPISLPAGLGELHGIAFNPANHHLYVFNPGQQQLHELTLQGTWVKSLDLSGLGLGQVRAMTFAPSLDQTDPAPTMHLYLVTSSGKNAGLSEWALAGLE
jgi:DNA-binding beta-propeller fold protein YncE